MNLRNIKYMLPVSALLLTMGLSSCTKDLDVESIDPNTSESVDAQSLFNKCYAEFVLEGNAPGDSELDLGDAGLSAMLDYRFDDHWEGTFFVQKTFVQPKTPMPLFLREDIGDKIGAEVRYHFNPAFSVGVSVWSGARQYFLP